jgi:L-cysteate sulfo-lyase
LSRFAGAIKAFPRIDLAARFTRIERLARIEEALGDSLGGARLFAKRDDIIGLGGGGSKLRKLEFLLGDAKSQGADTVITVGGRQSNHARLTAAAAAYLGLKCEIFLTQMVPRTDEDYQEGGNVLLDRLFGATIHALSDTDAMEHANRRADILRSEGRKVYVAPSGGSSPIGCMGYALCASEILEQSRSMGIQFGRVIVANGSSGTHAGLAAGFSALGLPASLVKSYSVLAGEEQTRKATIDLFRSSLHLLDQGDRFRPEEISVCGSERGAGYGAITQSVIFALRLMAEREGLLLDPVYSGKAFAGLLAGIREGLYSPGQNILFIMTGGIPGLFAYRKELSR